MRDLPGNEPNVSLWTRSREGTDECYDKHTLRADAPIPRMFFSPLVL